MNKRSPAVVKHGKIEDPEGLFLVNGRTGSRVTHTETYAVKRHLEYDTPCPKCGRTRDIMTFGLSHWHNDDTLNNASEEAFAWCPCDYKWIIIAVHEEEVD